MSFVVSSWRPRSASWLQGDRCDEKCVWPVNSVYSNIEFWTYGATPSKMDDVEIDWYRTCSHLQSGECGKDCAWCRYSVPSDEPLGLQSDWARCRCYDDRPMRYANPCPNNEDTDRSRCGSDCEFCNMSWPADDTAMWFSSEAECRCVPKDRYKIEFG